MKRKRPIRVRVIRRKGRRFLILKWRDQRGNAHEQTTQCTREREAWREAARLEQELAQAGQVEPVPWEIFRRRYELEVLRLQRANSLASWTSAANKLEALVGPEELGQIDADLVSRFTSAMFADGLSLPSIACYLRELGRGLRWAADVWPDYIPPRIRSPRVNKHDAMKGRPVTGEEVERMLEATPAVVRPKDVESWRFLIRGLWFSALRLGEALELDWEREDRIHVWGIDHDRPMLRIVAESEKGRRDRFYPIIPDFAELLWSVPEHRRRGRVFRPLTRRGASRSLEYVSARIGAIGKAAGVVVATTRDKKTGQSRVKYASAQDLRRGFGFRLAPLVHPLQLKELMRHESLETTLRYYVGVNAVRTARDVWEALERAPGRASDDISLTRSGARFSGSSQVQVAKELGELGNKDSNLN